MHTILRALGSSLLLAGAALAQSPPPPAPVSPSSAPAARPAPRVQSATEARDNATMPGQMRPEKRTAPLITVPLGRGAEADAETAPATGAAARAAARGGSGAPSSTSTIDDSMARCKAVPVGAARSDCLRKERVAKSATSGASR